MQIKDKERFLHAISELFASVNGISCTDVSSDEDEAYVHATTSAFIKAYVEYVLSKGDLRSPNYIAQTEKWVKEWIQNGPIFVMFNEPGLMEEVNKYIESHSVSEEEND